MPGTPGIDTIPGLSEIPVIADEENDPNWIAAGLLVQTGHDAIVQPILITDSARFACGLKKLLKHSLRHWNSHRWHWQAGVISGWLYWLVI